MQTAGPSGHSVLCGSSLALLAFDEAQTDEPPHERSEATLRALRKHPCAGEVVRGMEGCKAAAKMNEKRHDMGLWIMTVLDV